MSVEKNKNASSDSCKWLEEIPTEMNACSIEVLNCFNNITSFKRKLIDEDNDDEGMITLPLIIGCYELKDEINQIVKGQLRLYTISALSLSCVQDNDDKSQSNPDIICGQNISEIVDTEGGVFDGKFYEYSKIQLPPWFIQKQNDNNNISNIVDDNDNNKRWIYATACSLGKISFYALDFKMNDDRTSAAKLDQQHFPLPRSFYLSYITSTPTLDDDNNNNSSCLSIHWRNPQSSKTATSANTFLNSDSTNTACILSSYSNGYLAIHTIQFSCHEQEEENNENLQHRYPIISEKLKWDAHYYQFNKIREPAEVWSCCWINDNESIHLLSGGDDCKLKGWFLSSHYEDNAMVIAPILQFQIEHDAGVTCLSPHPIMPTIFVSGSYNEEIRLWDCSCLNNNNNDVNTSDDANTINKKKQTQPQLISSQPSCYGGIWRLKWHPIYNNMLLVAAMHGGAHIITILGLDISTENDEKMQDVSMNIASSFLHHESMVYGASWIVTTNQLIKNNVYDNENDDYHENDMKLQNQSYAATCSFYDQKAFVWKE